MRNNLFFISRSGWPYIAYALFASLIFAVLDLDFFSFISFIFALFFVYSFRNPERELSFLDEKAVVSPIDGVVREINELKDDVYTYKIIIESSYLNVCVLRVPLTSNLQDIKLIKGARTSKKSKLFSDLNETVELEFMDVYANKIKVVHRLKQSFASINIDINKHDVLLKGNRYGSALNGVTEIYLPKNFRLNIKPNSEIKASQTLVGYLS